MRKLFIALAAMFLAFSFTSCNDNGKENEDDNAALEINETTLAGTWEASVEHDFAQGYPQKWRIKFEGSTYTTWHTHQTAGGTGDDVQGLKTVGNKEQGTWEYADGVLTLIPEKQWASFAVVNLSTAKHEYHTYHEDTMECDDWYETSESLIKQGVAEDLENGSDWWIHKWTSVSLTAKTLSVKINMDTFKLEKK